MWPIVLVVLGASLLTSSLALYRREWGRKHEAVVSSLGVVGLLLVPIGGMVFLLTGQCRHAEVSWIRPDTEFVSQRSLNSMDSTELWLDEKSASTVARGSSEPAHVKAFEEIGSFARNLAPLTEADRERVKKHAAGFLRSSACE